MDNIIMYYFTAINSIFENLKSIKTKLYMKSESKF